MDKKGDIFEKFDETLSDIEFDEISTVTIEGCRGSGKTARAYLITELPEDTEGGDDAGDDA